MTMVRVAFVAMVAVLAVACGDKKEPLTPDNPSADPLMMDAGAGVPETPAPASSGDAK